MSVVAPSGYSLSLPLSLSPQQLPEQSTAAVQQQELQAKACQRLEWQVEEGHASIHQATTGALHCIASTILQWLMIP